MCITRERYLKLQSICILFTGLCIESWFVQHAPYFVHRGLSKPTQKLDNFECSRQQANAQVAEAIEFFILRIYRKVSRSYQLLKGTFITGVILSKCN